MEKKRNKKNERHNQKFEKYFSTKIVPGIKKSKSIDKKTEKSKKALNIKEIVEGILSGNKTVLGQAITLIESNSEAHRKKAEFVLKEILPHTGNTIRIGISGVPGAGKSTIIEVLGLYLINKGFKVAVLAVDPSSNRNRGSILGDKTRMENLSREKNSFIRPSPSGGALGGVTRKSRETMLICEAAGYDVILIETVGVGQNEITVREMVDFFLLIMISGAGDELQGIKKGVVEIADAIIINKADGNNIQKARLAANEYRQVFKFLESATKGWKTRVEVCSALENRGIDTIWEIISEFKDNTEKSGVFKKRRENQKIEWIKSMTDTRILEIFYNSPEIKKIMPDILEEVKSGKLLPTEASNIIIKNFSSKLLRNADELKVES